MTLRNSFPDAFSRRLLSTMMRLLFLLLAFSDHFWQSPSQSGSSPNDISPSSLPLGLRIGNHPILGQSSAVISAIPAKFTNNFVGAFLVEGSRPDQWGKLSMKSRTSLEEAERNRNLLFQMADVSGSPAELREKRRGLSDEKTKANSKKERPRKSGPNSGSAERKGQVKVMTGQFTDHQEQVTAAMTVSSSPAPSSTGKKSAEHRRKAERSASKEQKPSKSTTSKPPSDGGGAAVIVGHPNVTALSSHPHRHRKGQVQAQGQKRGGAGGGGRPPNWHELTSTEQSIAMMLRCQDLESRELLPSAVSCRNLRSDKVCNYLFHEVDRKTGRRDVKCNLQGIEDIAESCRKTCGICCEDINYACEDDKNGIIDCSRQLEKCHQKKWFGVLSRFCAGSCGLCAMTSCRDYDNSCRVRKTICLKPDSVDYMRENCARTCGFCVVGEDAGGGEKNKGDNRENKEKAVLVERPPLTQHRLIVPECTDKARNCSTNAHLCGNPAHGEYMVKFCTKTCLKCNQPHTSINSRAKTTEFPAPPPLEVIIQPMLGESEDTLLTRKCRDQHEKCAQWKAEGLCKANSTFKQEQRNKCPKSCELCRE